MTVKKNCFDIDPVHFFSFRSDYLKLYRQRTRSDLEGFNNFMSQGVRTEYLESVFPAESFPAWQTIQTGEKRKCQENRL